MIQQTFTMAVRVLAKNWLYSLLGVASLTMGLVVFLTNLAFVERARSMDDGLTFYDQIYEFHSVWSQLDLTRSGSTSPRVAEVLKSQFPEIKQVTRLLYYIQYVAETPRLRQYEKIFLADPNFFEVMDYPFVEGDPSTALDEPFSVILSQSTASRYFGKTSALGKTITLDGEHILRVTAVMEDLPITSSLRPGLGNLSIVAPIATFENMTPDAFWFSGWGADVAITLAVIPHSLSEQALKEGLESLVVDHWPEMFHETLDIETRPLAGMVYDFLRVGNVAFMDAVLALGVIVLLVGCANFAGLLIAQNIGRIKEVALRKAVGGGRRHIISQFLIEGLLMSALALMIALLIVPSYLTSISTDQFPIDFSALTGTRGLIWLMLLAPLVALVGGLYPALKVSAAPPSHVFQEDSAIVKHAGAFRGTAITVQFVFAIALLIGTIVTWLQQTHLQKLDLRYAQDQILIIDKVSNPKIRNQLPLLKQLLTDLPGVQAVSVSSQVPSDNRYTNEILRKIDDDPENTYWLTNMFIDPDFFSIYDLKMVAGRPFSDEKEADIWRLNEDENGAFQINVILNEGAVRKLGWSSPVEAIGQVLTIGGVQDAEQKTQLTIVGVVEDARLRNNSGLADPAIFRIYENQFTKTSVRLSTANVKDAVASIELVWEDLYPDYPIKWQFLDDGFALAYKTSSRNQLILAFCCTFALVISALGMFGLAGYVAETRTKEIGVRKVMGASVGRIVRLLLWDFSKPVLIANLVAWPLAYLAMRNYLDGFADRIALSPIFFLGAGVAALLIAWLVVAVHVVRAARTHPVHALRYE